MSEVSAIPSTGDRRSTGAASAAAIAASCLMLVLVLGMTSAAPAHAAGPGWKLLGVTKPTNLPPRQSEVQRLTVEAQAGTFTLSRVTGAAQGTLSFGGGFASPYIAGATQITAFATAGAFAVGQEFVTGSGIAPGTTVTSVSGSIVGLSQPTQGAGSGAVSAASKTVTGLTGVSGEFRVGDAISGAGIPAATTVAAVSGDTLTLSAFPTQGGAKALQATETTGPVDFDADPQDLQAALEALPAHPAGSVTVTGGPGGDQDHPYFIEFGGPLADRDITQFTATGSFPDPGERAMVATTVPGGLGQVAFNLRDRFLRIVANRRGLLVPSLVADVRHAPEHASAEEDHPEDEVDLLAGALTGGRRR